jgi:hypothetical protein
LICRHWFSAPILAAALAGQSHAQITRLPSTGTIPGALSPEEGEASTERPRNFLTGYPSELSQPLLPEGQPSAGPVLPGGVLGGEPYRPGTPMLLPDGTLPPVAPAPTLPKGAKPGIFQQALVAETYLPRFGGDNGFGINDVLVQATFGFPFFTRENPLVVTPAFEIQMLDGPTAPSLPPELYDASISFLHIRKFSDTFSMHFGATPGVHSDFQKSSSEAVRVPARLLGVWEWRPNTQLILGALYLARDDVNFLPAGGIIWTPNDDTRLELIFPRPRYAQRFFYAGDIEWWWYVAGEFGGGSYAVRDAAGFGSNVITLSDLRAILGLERRVTGGINSRIELGYVFARKVEFQETLPTFEADPTLLVRGGLSY